MGSLGGERGAETTMGVCGSGMHFPWYARVTYTDSSAIQFSRDCPPGLFATHLQSPAALADGDMFLYDQHGNIPGLNHGHALIGFAQSMSNLNMMLIGICTIFDFDRTRAGDDNRDTQMRIGALIEAEGAAGDEAEGAAGNMVTAP